ncbi:MAG: hypothetical protein GY943_29830 [Chloroflexi bacterium]|nr:hypothetical protein [Chloroflexota bacterium]
MSDSASSAWPFRSSSKRTTPNGKEQVRWEVVARTMGLTPATIIAGRLQTEGLPVRVWQESAGRAIGLMVGSLGTGHVAVPEQFVEQALDILEDDEAYEFDEDEWDEKS